MNVVHPIKSKEKLEEMKEELKKLGTRNYLFNSRKGFNRPITTTQAYRIIANAGLKCSIKNIGTHTMRKTFRIFSLQTVP